MESEVISDMRLIYLVDADNGVERDYCKVVPYQGYLKLGSNQAFSCVAL